MDNRIGSLIDVSRDIDLSSFSAFEWNLTGVDRIGGTESETRKEKTAENGERDVDRLKI